MIFTYLKNYIVRKKMLKSKVIVKGGLSWDDLSKISIDKYCYIGPQSKFWGRGEIKISKNVIIGPNVTIMTSNHNYMDAKLIPYDEINHEKKVLIEENVWIGANVSIVPGVTIGEGAVVAMGSVITRNVPKLAIVGGNPAKIIKYRDLDKYNELKENEKFYMKKKYFSV